MRNLYWIKDKNGKKVRFIPNSAQFLLFEKLKASKRLIVLKSRQLGITTGFVLWILDECLFNRNRNAITIMQSRDHAVEAFDGKAHYAWLNLSPELKESLGWSMSADRANQLAFSFGDGTDSKYSVATTGRSGTFQYAHVSELSPLEAERPSDAKEVLSGTLPAVPQSGVAVIESTAASEYGLFRDYWDGAVDGKNGFDALFLNFRHDEAEISATRVIPVESMPVEFREIQERHKLSGQEVSYYFNRWQELNRDWMTLRREYPITPEEAFIGSSDKLFDQDSIDEHLASARDGKSRGGFNVFSAPRPGRVYAIGADPSGGVGRDANAAVVLDVSGAKPSVACEYASDSVSPEDFAYVLKELSETYNDATVCIERNNHGLATITVFRNIADEEVLYRDTDQTKIYQRESDRFGFRTTAASKPGLLLAFGQALKDFLIDVPSRAILKEARAYPRELVSATKVDPSTTRHFDLLIAACLAWHARIFAIDRSPINVPVTGTMAVSIVPSRKRDFDPHSGV